MQDQDQKLGVWGVPGTFPTSWIGRVLYRDAGQLWDRSKINRLYFWYKEGVEKNGLPPYDEGQTEIVNWMAENSEYTENDIKIFLVVLRNEVLKEKVDLYFLNFKEPQTAPVRWAKNLDPEVIFRRFMWIAGLSVLGLALFYGGPMIRRITKATPKKRKK